MPLGRRVRSLLMALAALVAVSASAGGQTESPAEPPTFRASANLVTIDAVVTNEDGRHVTDLTIDDFEVSHSGKKQRLQHALYVAISRSGVKAPLSPPVADAAAGVAALPSRTPARSLTRALVAHTTPPRRTIAFVVDDLGLSFRSTVDVRRALRHYVDTQIEPGDLVAIVRTGGGIGALQQFTTDRRLLDLAVDRVEWNGLSRQGITAFAPVAPNGPVGDVDAAIGGPRDQIMARGSLGAIEFVTRGMQQLPGRKSMVLFTESFGDLFGDRGESGQIWRALARMLDRANRAGVVVYTVDPRGLQTSGLTAEDNPQLRDWGLPGESSEATAVPRNAARDRLEDLMGTQEALRFVADQTGGLFFGNSNDLNLGIRKALDDQRGYYLLGYPAPEGASTSGWEQNRIKVRVKRPGLRVRARQGFFGPAEPDADKDEAMADPLLLAAMSPFGGGAINVRLTSLFGHDSSAGPYIRSLLFIDPGGLTFTRNPEGRHEARAEVLQAAVGDNGEVLGNWRRTITLRLTDEQLEEARAHGVVYNTRMAVKKPGAYQVRTAIQDLASSAVGSASQFLEVPEVGKGRLALSGVLLQAKASDATAAETAASELEFSEAGDAETDILGKPTLRIFTPGSEVVYAYEVYDGLDEKRSQALEMRTTLLRNGRVVYEGPSEPIKAQKKTSRVRTIPIAGLLSLGDDVPAGTYTLQVSVAADKKRRASGWVDLEVRK